MKTLIYRQVLGVFLAVSVLFSASLVFAQQNQDDILLEAAQNGDLEAAKTSLANGANVHARDKNGVAALLHAALYNTIDIVKLLLSKGAHVDAEDTTNSTAWVIATELGYTELAKVLREANAAERFDSLEWSGSYSYKKESAELIITNSFQWEKTWAKLGFEAGPPEIDFNKYVIAGVFLGVRPTGGYDVKFGEPYQEEGKTVIPYDEIKPGPGQFVTQALTQSYRLKVFKRGGEASILRKREDREAQ